MTKIKIDTGARTSVLHCSKIQIVEDNGQHWVKFHPLDSRFLSPGKTYILPFQSRRTIKNSFGQEEERYVITTTIVLFGESYEIELSLRDRSEMEFPVLLGRRFIRKRFLVDVSKADLANPTF